MARSMTAYGRAHAETDKGLFLIEIQSVNRKHLDININLPKEFLMFDILFRKILVKNIRRGCILVRVTNEEKKALSQLAPCEKTLKNLYGSWANLAKSLGYDPKEAITFNQLINHAMTLHSSVNFDEQVTRNQLKKGFEDALSHLIKMKNEEGRVLINDILQRLDIIKNYLNQIQDYAKNSPERFYQRLLDRLESVNIAVEDDKERLMKELIIYTDKLDITEEIIRLHSHLNQFRKVLETEKSCVGKELEFLMQEMNRESNTIVAKSQEINITQSILVIKNEQEKIREQLQNIE